MPTLKRIWFTDGDGGTDQVLLDRWQKLLQNTVVMCLEPQQLGKLRDEKTYKPANQTSQYTLRNRRCEMAGHDGWVVFYIPANTV